MGWSIEQFTLLIIDLRLITFEGNYQQVWQERPQPDMDLWWLSNSDGFQGPSLLTSIYSYSVIISTARCPLLTPALRFIQSHPFNPLIVYSATSVSDVLFHSMGYHPQGSISKSTYSGIIWLQELLANRYIRKQNRYKKEDISGSPWSMMEARVRATRTWAMVRPCWK